MQRYGPMPLDREDVPCDPVADLPGLVTDLPRDDGGLCPDDARRQVLRPCGPERGHSALGVVAFSGGINGGAPGRGTYAAAHGLGTIATRAGLGRKLGAGRGLSRFRGQREDYEGTWTALISQKSDGHSGLLPTS